MKFDTESFAKAIRGKLVYGDSLNSIAKETGISRSTIWRMLNDKKDNSKISSILLVCEWLDKPITDFITKS